MGIQDDSVMLTLTNVPSTRARIMATVQIVLTHSNAIALLGTPERCVKPPSTTVPRIPVYRVCATTLIPSGHTPVSASWA